MTDRRGAYSIFVGRHNGKKLVRPGIEGRIVLK
jgi:hypothetical protein